MTQLVFEFARQESPLAVRALRPFFYYFGGKRRCAPLYPAPRYGKIIEPFAGAAGYSTLYADRDVTLRDASPVVCGVWDYLIHATEQEILSLPVPVAHVDELAVCQEARWLIGFWLNTGTAHPSKQPSKWMRDGWRPHSCWGQTVRAMLASQVGRIRHWGVSCGDYSESPDEEATWFVDPPYKVVGERHYPSKVDDYAALAVWCRSRLGQVIVCERGGADWLPFTPLGRIKTLCGKSGKVHSEEAVYYQNGKEV